MSLPIITAADLPRQAYGHDKDHDLALTQPEKFRAPINSTYDPKPLAGGLWTAPVCDVDPDTGAILSTDWSRYLRQGGLSANDCAGFLEIVPAPGFKGLAIDSLDDAAAVLGEYRVAAEPAFLGHFWAAFDWEQMAADGYDALYLTAYGQGVTRIPEDRSLSLYGWDCASVLWIRPTYRVVVP